MFGLVTSADTHCENVVKSAMNCLTAMATHYGQMKELFDSTINECQNVIFNEVATNNDFYTLRKMLKLSDSKEFVIAMQKEIDNHQNRDHWEIFVHGTAIWIRVWRTWEICSEAQEKFIQAL